MVVSVEFRGSPWKHYDYLTDLDLKRGDLVIVPTGSTPLQEFAVVRVVGTKKESERATAWVAQKVDVEGFKKRMETREMEAMLE